MSGLTPAMADLGRQLLGAARQIDPRFRITSGYRSRRAQIALYRKFLRGESVLPVAPPGKSLHELGLAVDISRGADPFADEALAQLGAWWRAAGLGWSATDPVHFQLPAIASPPTQALDVRPSAMVSPGPVEMDVASTSLASVGPPISAAHKPSQGPLPFAASIGVPPLAAAAAAKVDALLNQIDNPVVTAAVAPVFLGTAALRGVSDVASSLFGGPQQMPRDWDPGSEPWEMKRNLGLQLLRQARASGAKLTAGQNYWLDRGGPPPMAMVSVAEPTPALSSSAAFLASRVSGRGFGRGVQLAGDPRWPRRLSTLHKIARHLCKVLAAFD